MRIIETCIYAENLDEVGEFYRRLLGVEPFAEHKDRHIFFKLENGMLLIFNPSTTSNDKNIPPHGCKGKCHVAFAVEYGNINEWKKKLKALGIEIEKEITWPAGGMSIYFRDPAGNSVEITTPDTWGFNWKNFTKS